MHYLPQRLTTPGLKAPGFVSRTDPMRYDEQDRESKNVEDRRGQGGGGFGMPLPPDY